MLACAFARLVHAAAGLRCSASCTRLNRMGIYNRRPGSGMPPTGMNRQEALEARNLEAAERAARMIQ